MRIGLVIYGSLDTLSGGYLYDRKLVEHLRQQGDEVEIISLPWRSYARNLSDNLSPHLYARLAGGNYDVLLQDELNHPSLFQINTRLRGGERNRIGYPIISVVHHLRSSELRPNWQNRLFRLVENRYLRSVDGFIFNSQTTRRAVYATGGSRLESCPAVVAYPAGDELGAHISDKDIRARAHHPGPLEIIFVGNWIARKGLHTLLTALGRLPGDACRLTVVGEMQDDPGYTHRVRRRIERLQLADRVTLRGRLPADELSQALRQAHVLAVPSSYEGFGIVYLEGMAFGLPAIATRAGAAAEIITPGENGLLVPPEDAGALAAALAALAEDRKMLSRMGQAARRRYLKHPTWEETTANIRSFLVETAQRFDYERRA